MWKILRRSITVGDLIRRSTSVHRISYKNRHECIRGRGGEWEKIDRDESGTIERKKSTAPGIPRRSPIQVLTGLDVA